MSKKFEFVECDTCRKNPGCPMLCDGCLHNRTVIEELNVYRFITERQRANCCNQAFYEGWQAHKEKPLGDPVREWLDSKVFSEVAFFPPRDDKATAAAAMKPWSVSKKPFQCGDDLKVCIEMISKALETNAVKLVSDSPLPVERVGQIAQTLKCLCSVLHDVLEIEIMMKKEAKHE